MNKRGFIRTLEAVIAIIIVFVFIYAVSQSNIERDSAKVDSIRSLQEEVLRGISENEEYRKEVLELSSELLNEDLKGKNLEFVNHVRDNLGGFSDRYALVVCEPNNCGIPSSLSDKERVYTSAVIISSSLESSYDPKIVRLWVW